MDGAFRGEKGCVEYCKLKVYGGKFRIDGLLGQFFATVSHFNDLAHVRLSRGNENQPTESDHRAED